MEARQLRGLEIAARCKITKSGEKWIVPSQSEKGTYLVSMKGKDGPSCTCPDHESRGVKCKHTFAVEFVMQRELFTETTPEGTTTTRIKETAAVRISYPQNWPAYNQAQTQEKAIFCTLLRDLCAGVPQPTQEKGRPRMPMADALFAATFKVYSTISSRRFATDLREAHEAGFIAKAYHFNSVLNTIEDETLTPLLYDLVAASAAPLKAVESTFAVDSTGFGTQQYYRHYSAKYGREIEARDWIKLHAVIGTKTNVIAAASITDKHANDSPEFAPLLAMASENFKLERVTADKAYSSRKNVQLVADYGGMAFIPFRANSRAVSPVFGTTPAWRKLWHYYEFQRDEFLTYYHARSNVESTFSSMKRVLGDTLRSKTRPAQVNELLFKCIAYNIVCLVHSIFELGVQMPDFCTQTSINAQKVGA